MTARTESRFTAALCVTGLLLGTLFFAASLGPGLLPRTWAMQGILSGFSLAIGYGIGAYGRRLWRWLELPRFGERWHTVAVIVAGTVCLGVMLAALWHAAAWQNSLRALMGLAPVDSAHPFRVGGVALLVFGALLGVARLFQMTWRFFARKFGRFIPRRVAALAGVVAAIFVFWTIINGVLFSQLLRSFDASFQGIDARIEAETAAPVEPWRTGSGASLIAWEDLGRRGREFIAAGPTLESLQARFGSTAQAPLRIYVGLNSGETIQSRVDLAMAELDRVGAWDRSVLVLVTPTGTGWIDPNAIETLELLHRGDVATVALQYSYLPSWLSLMAEGEYGAETARATFAAIYGRWTSLPRDQRPKLYLHGLSLGALNSALAADIYDVIADPLNGALWSGPPFRSVMWRTLTDQREPSSPAWLPRFRDGSVVRFTNQTNALDLPDAQWGPMRIVYLQYASDAITFYETRAAFRQPAWMEAPRGPDVSPALRWYPVVTMLQLAVDIVAADKAPMGFGHVYAPEHYLDAWVAVSDPEGWDSAALQALRDEFRARR
ncbi:MAG: alpha/beta-hydrolase family protein [Gemmatimonadales bacterium]|nr:alpha/beta-hydrolase family protein [Gemmatimonadales bacterium]